MWYSPGALSYASAMTILAWVAPALVVTMAPLMVASEVSRCAGGCGFRGSK